MAERLTFTLTGRDELSRVLNGTGDSADRLRLRLSGITADADGQLRDLHGRFLSVADAQARLADRTAGTQDAFRTLRTETGRLGDSLKANLISLAPAAIPLTAGLAGSAAVLAGQFGAVAVAAGAYALALGPQIVAIGEAADAHKKYDDAVAQSGASSQEAAKAQSEYQRQLAKLPAPTREAAVAVGLLKDNYQEWSDSLAGDVLGPFTKGVAVTNALLPKTTGLVKGTSTQFDRLITLVGGAVASPGFDALNDRFTRFTTDTLDHGIDRLTVFLARLQSGDFNGGALREWWDYAQDVGPQVFDTLESVGEALLNVLEAGAGVGVGMLEVINALSGVVSAVPPEAIAALLQLAIAIKAVKLAGAGSAAASAAIAAIGVQVAAMRTAAVGAPGVIAGVTAAIAALSRGAKLAVAGTGLGLLLIAMTQIAAAGDDAGPDVDKLTTSIGNLGRTGKASGYVVQQFGADFGKLREQIQRVIDPSVAESVNNWGADISGGLLDAGDATEDFTKSIDAIDDSLASLVSSGHADIAAAAVKELTKGLNAEELKKFNSGLGDYRQAQAAATLEQKIAAESMGLFGEQAQQVQGELEMQKNSTDGLRQSIIALNDVNRAALGAQNAFEQAIDDTTKAARENAGALTMSHGQLDLNSQKARDAEAALRNLASRTDEATTAARDSGASWGEVSGIYERGRQQLIKNAMQMGLNRGQARALADQILKTPDKTAFLKGDVADLKRKIAEAKERLRNAPSEKKAHIRGEIEQLKKALADARRRLDGIDGTTAYTYVVTRHKREDGRSFLGASGRYATGGPVVPGFPGGGLLLGPGTGTSDSIPILASNGEYVVKATSVAKYGLRFLDALNDGRLPAGRAARPGLPAPAAPTSAPSGGDVPRVTYNVYPRQSVISVEDLRLIQRQEEARQRVGRPG